MPGRAAKNAADVEPRTDRELVYAARDGDMQAFDALFYRYKDGIFRLGLAITKDPSAAEEIVVDTFARAHRALARLEPETSLRPWLYRVAINLSYNRRPRKGLVLSTIEDVTEEVMESFDRSPSRLAELAELRSVVLAAVDTLGPKHKIVVVLHYLNGLNLAEIAQVVDCPVGTVKSRLHYALRRLRVHLASHPELGFEPAAALLATSAQMPLATTPPLRLDEQE
ncbi:MAG: sigma-70 family RNA polymerase sigma factor [Candidatus Limnocylindria bacterium]|nr:sigma-70 family RNA polymerase sigma factor [Candidatus Limnocylindria bacterium]